MAFRGKPSGLRYGSCDGRVTACEAGAGRKIGGTSHCGKKIKYASALLRYANHDLLSPRPPQRPTHVADEPPAQGSSFRTTTQYHGIAALASGASSSTVIPFTPQIGAAGLQSLCHGTLSYRTSIIQPARVGSPTEPLAIGTQIFHPPKSAQRRNTSCITVS